MIANNKLMWTGSILKVGTRLNIRFLPLKYYDSVKIIPQKFVQATNR